MIAISVRQTHLDHAWMTLPFSQFDTFRRNRNVRTSLRGWWPWGWVTRLPGMRFFQLWGRWLGSRSFAQRSGNLNSTLQLFKPLAAAKKEKRNGQNEQGDDGHCNGNGQRRRTGVRRSGVRPGFVGAEKLQATDARPFPKQWTPISLALLAVSKIIDATVCNIVRILHLSAQSGHRERSFLRKFKKKKVQKVEKKRN